jgi:hypothetical protein
MLRTLRKTALHLGVLAALPVMAQPANFKPCPFTVAELQSAFGMKFEEGKASPPLNAGTVSMQSCRYDAKDITVSVQSQLYQNVADAKKAATIAAGKLVPISNDPDGAAYQEGQGDLTAPALQYARGTVATSLRIMGVYYKDYKTKEKDMKALREKLAKLRRVP